MQRGQCDFLRFCREVVLHEFILVPGRLRAPDAGEQERAHQVIEEEKGLDLLVEAEQHRREQRALRESEQHVELLDVVILDLFLEGAKTAQEPLELGGILLEPLAPVVELEPAVHRFLSLLPDLEGPLGHEHAHLVALREELDEVTQSLPEDLCALAVAVKREHAQLPLPVLEDFALEYLDVISTLPVEGGCEQYGTLRNAERERP